jgi:two pore calcium channel protein 1
MIIYFVFALIGMALFGGVIRKNLEIFSDNTNNGAYYMDNFNDMLSSFVTLFTLMVVNNW